MPLRDKHRDIIGTFGISRNITELKQAQQKLEDAYVEIQVLNVEETSIMFDEESYYRDAHDDKFECF